jgi:hypothetical protein
MLIKQDFSNLLVKEIYQLEETIKVINEEIAIRTTTTGLTPLEEVQNKRMIINLQNELKSKNEFLFKLREKHLHDEPELEEDFASAINGVEEAKALVLEVKDPHDKARCAYLLTELELWLSKTSFPEYREASGFYYKGLKMSLRDSGIDI